MAFVFTIDERPSVLGNLLLLSGTFVNTGGDDGGPMALNTHLNSVVACGAAAGTATAGTGAGVDGVFALIPPAPAVGVTIQCVANQDGTWWALGKR